MENQLKFHNPWRRRVVHLQTQANMSDEMHEGADNAEKNITAQKQCHDI